MKKERFKKAAGAEHGLRERKKNRAQPKRRRRPLHTAWPICMSHGLRGWRKDVASEGKKCWYEV
ncbi:hypothetical protein A6B38_00155 [Bartonella bacilliformis]|uniref:Uncharacterized protein n=1 Tax=Bartonella bacilliformis INS TaxID=1206782 RepID=A0ABP2SPE8_BARBA|nr:hypothetical protein AL467_00995 [Bartonella bacilliformis]EKS46067.1 hypothetical protein BbINS_00855 [Bartonella bacilliformis INS]KZN22121.1 hypothetical protein A6B38_00155 [Bartonella bacilliformis]